MGGEQLGSWEEAGLGPGEAAAGAGEFAGNAQPAAQAEEAPPSLAHMTVLEKPTARAQPRWHSRRRRAAAGPPAQAEGNAAGQPGAPAPEPAAENRGAGVDASHPGQQPEAPAAAAPDQAADLVQRMLAHLMMGPGPAAEAVATPGALLGLIKAFSPEACNKTLPAAQPEPAPAPHGGGAQPPAPLGQLPALAVPWGGNADEHGAPAACEAQGGPRTPSPRSGPAEEAGPAPQAGGGESHLRGAAVSPARRVSAVPFGSPAVQPRHGLRRGAHSPATAADEAQRAARTPQDPGAQAAYHGTAPAQPAGAPAGPAPAAGQVPDQALSGKRRAEAHMPDQAPQAKRHRAEQAGRLGPATGEAPDQALSGKRRAEAQTPDQAPQAKRHRPEQAGRLSSGGGRGLGGLWGLAVPIMETVALGMLGGQRPSTPQRQARHPGTSNNGACSLSFFGSCTGVAR